MIYQDQAERIMASLSRAIRRNRRLRIFAAVALTILLISGLSPHVGGAVASVVGLGVLFLVLPSRRERGVVAGDQASREAGQ